MGELGGFLKIDRAGSATSATRPSASRDYREFVVPLPRRRAARAGRALHGLRRAVLPQRLPARQPDPRLERPRLPRRLAARRSRQLHATNNFPEFTGRLCPGAVRGRLRARDQRGRRGHDQADRERDHRPRLGGGLGRRRSRRARETGRSVAVVGSGPAGHGRRPAAAPRRPPRRRCSSATRPAGGLVRFGVPDFKIEKRVVERRVQQLVAEGVELRCGVDVGRRRHRRRAARASSTRSSLAIGSRVPRDLPVPGRELDGVHFAMDYLYERNRWVATQEGPEPRAARARAPGDHRRRQARRRDRRRRHRRGLRRQLDPRGRAVGRRSSSCSPEPPAAASRRPHAVAAVAAEVPPLLRDGGGAGRRQGRAGLLGRRRRTSAARTARSRAQHIAQAEPAPPFGPVAGHRARAARRPRPAGDGLPPPGAARASLEQLGVRRGPARQRRRAATYATSVAGRLRRGRRAPRPVADRVGDQRGPPVRADGRAPPRRAAGRKADACVTFAITSPA